nr:hypothetical protein [Tanacetum cinerariifolium]
MLLCKQAEQGVPLQAEQYDWLADTIKEINEQELEAHYSYMEKIQEVPTADSGTDSEPLEQVQNDVGYNMFANDLQHSEQSESISNTCLVETDDSNVIPDSLDMRDDDIQNDQNNVESDDERSSEVVVGRLARNANPLALVATAQANQDPYYQTSKSHKPYAPSSKPHFIILQSFVMTTPTVTSSTDSQMHNNIMAASSRDRPLMLATGRYPQWRSRFSRYIDTRPNDDALRKCILNGPYKPTTVLVQAVAATDDSPAIPEHTTVETPMNMSPENKAQFQVEK